MVIQYLWKHWSAWCSMQYSRGDAVGHGLNIHLVYCWISWTLTRYSLIHISYICCGPHNLGTGAPCARAKTFECLPIMVCMFPKADYPSQKPAPFLHHIQNAPQNICIMYI